MNIIGLILALAIIVNSSMVVDSYRSRVFEEYISNDILEPDITIWSKIDTTSPDELASVSDFSLYSQIINRCSANIKYDDYLVKQRWYSNYQTGIWINQAEQDNQTEKVLEIPLRAPEDDFFNKISDYLIPGSKLPKKSNEIILVVRGPVADTSYRIGKELNLTSYSYSGENSNNNVTVSIVGLLETPVNWSHGSFYYYKDETELSELEKLIWEYCSSYYEYQSRHGIILTTAEKAVEIASRIVPSEGLHEVFESELRGKIFLDHKKFDGFNIPVEIEKLTRFVLEIEDGLVFNVGKYPYVGDQIVFYLQMYESVIFNLIIFLLLFSIPVLSISLYLVSYSFGLIWHQKRVKIGILKTRGASTFQVLAILFVELIFSSVLAAMTSIIFGYVLTNIVLRSTDFLTFTGRELAVEITATFLVNLTVLGLIVAVLVNVIGTIRMGMMDIVETAEPVESRNPIWKRFYLDILSTGLGFFGFYLFHLLTRASEYNPLLNLILLFLGIPAPFLLFTGSILLVARAIPLVIIAFSRLIWRVENGLAAFALRNVMRHEKAVNRAIILVTLALSFSLITSSMIFSADETARINLYYSAGADLNITTTSPFNKTVYSILAKNVSHVASITKTINAEIVTSGSLNQQFTFVFLDPETYAETAFFSSICKISSELSVLMDRIADNKSIVMLKNNFDAHSNLTINGNFVMLLPNGTSKISYPLGVAGTFSCWPQLYSYTKDPLRDYYCIGSLGLYQYLNSSGYLRTRSYSYLIKVEPNSNVQEIVDSIESQTGLIPNAPSIAYENYKKEFGRRFFLTVLNSDILISITVAVIGIILFAFFTYSERGKEIGIERALGMTRVQTGLLFAIEGFTILAIGIITGIAIGLSLTSVFLSVTHVEQIIPPIVVVYPLGFIIYFLIGVTVTAAIGTLIPAYLATKKDISKILKVE